MTTYSEQMLARDWAACWTEDIRKFGKRLVLPDELR